MTQRLLDDLVEGFVGTAHGDKGFIDAVRQALRAERRSVLAIAPPRQGMSTAHAPRLLPSLETVIMPGDRVLALSEDDDTVWPSGLVEVPLQPDVRLPATRDASSASTTAKSRATKRYGSDHRR